ncbi:spinster family MFS transporter [Sphingobium subterraneum]|uniref:MFS family permease n=1 Tax=Sphingobium subterraneum TaxID=627688 RepID=A0A841J652_9SPHN|nr:MFS transporter [Sphingobium subterraneum]MBB6123691.1 MFS family permease [Sphingobium subterraneum]
MERNLTDEAQASPTSTAHPAGAAADWSWRSNGYAWWVVVVLALALTLSLMDRMIMALMIAPIQRDLALSDTQVSLIHGFAFTILYVLAGFPLGRIADRGSRRSVAGFSVFAWSVMTALCGSASNAVQLFLARMGVGVGEAGLSPAAISLISDYFPKKERARPLAFLTIGTTAGAGIAMMIGGSIIAMAGSAQDVVLPLFGPVHTWQAVFIILGVAGMLFAAIFLTVREPPRSERATTDVLPRTGEVAAFIIARRRFYIPHFLGTAMAVLVLIGFHTWMPTMLIRSFGWTAAQSGYAYGAIIALGGVTGILCSGWISVRLNRQGRTNVEISLVLWSALGALPFLAIAPLMPSGAATLVVIYLGIALLTVPSALAPTILQAITPNEMRAQLFAVYLLVISIGGYALGPLAVALITDKVLGDPLLLHLSLSVTAAIGLPVSALLMRRARSQTLKA